MRCCQHIFCHSAAQFLQITSAADCVQVGKQHSVIRACFSMLLLKAKVCHSLNMLRIMCMLWNMCMLQTYMHPADQVQRCTVQGNTPPLQQALELHSILTQSDTNLRQPVALKEQLLLGRMGSDVAQSMLQMLQVKHGRYVFCCLWGSLDRMLSALKQHFLHQLGSLLTMPPSPTRHTLHVPQPLQRCILSLVHLRGVCFSFLQSFAF